MLQDFRRTTSPFINQRWPRRVSHSTAECLRVLIVELSIYVSNTLMIYVAGDSVHAVQPCILRALMISVGFLPLATRRIGNGYLAVFGQGA